MNPKIGKMMHRVQLVHRKIEHQNDGDIVESIRYGKSVWASISPYQLPTFNMEDQWNNLKKKYPLCAYKIGMRFFYIRDALQSDLLGLIFKGKIMKMFSSVALSKDMQWAEFVVVDYGVTEGYYG